MGKQLKLAISRKELIRNVGKSARAKGARGENETTDILCILGVPSQKVIASGAVKGAEGDIKVGIALMKDGSFPERDESLSVLRGEIKNRQINREEPYDWLKNKAYILMAPEKAPDLPFTDLAQSKKTKVLFWKRKNTPHGALKPGRYNEAYLAIMGIEDFADLVRLVLRQKKKIRQLKKELDDAHKTIRKISSKA